jgi:type IV pilus assembly protein PilW
MKSISTRTSRAQLGFTLVELLIALALGMFVLIGLSSVFFAVKQSFRFQETSGRLQEDAAFALDTISRDLRMAGQAGCLGISSIADPLVPANPPTYYPGTVVEEFAANIISGSNPLSVVEPAVAAVVRQPLTPGNFVRGFDGIPSAMFSSSVPVNTATDSLFFAGASSNSVAVNAAMVTAASAVSLATDTFGWRSPANATRTFVISNCAASNIFTGITTASGAGAQITHDTSAGNASNEFTFGTLYGTDSVVMPLEWSFYYVTTRAGATTPGLYRAFYDGRIRRDAEELVSNVESMRLHYGVSNVVGGVPTRNADNWVTTAAAVTDWSLVVAVRVGLMLVSATDNANPDVTLTTPTLLGAAYTLPAGASANRLRKEFSTTVVLRNAVAAR